MKRTVLVMLVLLAAAGGVAFAPAPAGLTVYDISDLGGTEEE
jgi:hypothetical protein